MASMVEILSSSRVVQAHSGASVEDLKDLKQTCPDPLPSDYLDYLAKIGWAQIGERVLYGLGPDAPDSVNVSIIYTDGVVADVQLRSSLMPLMSAGKGKTFCLDLSDRKKTKTNECPVVVWDENHPDAEMQKCKVVAKTFAQWIVKIVDVEENSR